MDRQGSHCVADQHVQAVSGPGGWHVGDCCGERNRTPQYQGNRSWKTDQQAGRPRQINKKVADRPASTDSNGPTAAGMAISRESGWQLRCVPASFLFCWLPASKYIRDKEEDKANKLPRLYSRAFTCPQHAPKLMSGIASMFHIAGKHPFCPNEQIQPSSAWNRPKQRQSAATETMKNHHCSDG